MRDLEHAWQEPWICLDIRLAWVRALTRDDVPVGVALYEPSPRQGGQPAQRARRVVADRDEIAQYPIAVHAAVLLDIGQDRIQGDRVAVDIRQKGQARLELAVDNDPPATELPALDMLGVAHANLPRDRGARSNDPS